MNSDLPPVLRPLTLGTPEEKAKRLGVPLIPKRTLPQFKDKDIIAVCGQCGREVNRVEMYACMNEKCPLKPRQTLSTVK